jgi:hypothetical protein
MEKPAQVLAAYSMWDNTLSDYTCLTLTSDMETLPGIACLTRLFGKWSGDRYYAGIWENDSLFGLTWDCNSRLLNVVKERPTPYIAPSWSWACMKQFCQGSVTIQIGTHGAYL